MRADKIYLVGFMGAGKSTVAAALGARLRWSVEDIDERIEAQERRTITDLFAREGEDYFRQVERDVLRQLLPVRHVVVATGGGTFVDPENRRTINADGVSIWLDVPFETLVRRIPSDGRRPLATDREAMRSLWHTRRAAYAAAHLHLDAETAPVGKLVDHILDWASD